MSQQATDLFKPSSLYSILFLMVMGFILILSRLTFIQWVQHERWVKLADRAQEKNVIVEAERGTIYDRNGQILAINIDRSSVYAIPAEIKNPIALSRRLAPLLGLGKKNLLKKLRKNAGFVWLKRKIEPDKMKKVDALKMAGIHAVMESKRIYPRQSLFGHLLGFSGLDNQGLEGIERKHDARLRGKEGVIILQRDAYGKSVFPKDFQYIKPSPGNDLHLTVDERIQHISERELGRIVKKTGAKGGTVIVMDPWSGEILAMAIQPEFNPNLVRISQPSEWRNRAISDFYEPGSTFKIVTASAALEEDLVTADDLIDCEKGLYFVKGTTIHDHDPFGIIPFHQVIAHSSNIGTIKVAEILGKDRLASYVRAFGFGKRLGVDLIGESPGLVRNIKKWSGRSLASIAIGQEVGVTPLQMVTATSVLANGGWLMTPQIVLGKPDKQGNRQTVPQIKRRVLSEETTRAMTKILKEVVSTDGTARRAAIQGYTVAGKTGTAQKIDPETGRYARHKFVSSFVGYVPAEDPVLTILVMVDEPEGISWGGEIAAPVFANIAQEVLPYLKVTPDNGPPRHFPNQVANRPVKAIQVSSNREILVRDAYYKIGPSR